MNNLSFVRHDEFIRDVAVQAVVLRKQIEDTVTFLRPQLKALLEL
jgi:hypothetical protein